MPSSTSGLWDHQSGALTPQGTLTTALFATLTVHLSATCCGETFPAQIFPLMQQVPMEWFGSDGHTFWSQQSPRFRSKITSCPKEQQLLGSSSRRAARAQTHILQMSVDVSEHQRWAAAAQILTPTQLARHFRAPRSFSLAGAQLWSAILLLGSLLPQLASLPGGNEAPMRGYELMLKPAEGARRAPAAAWDDV